MPVTQTPLTHCRVQIHDPQMTIVLSNRIFPPHCFSDAFCATGSVVATSCQRHWNGPAPQQATSATPCSYPESSNSNLLHLFFTSSIDKENVHSAGQSVACAFAPAWLSRRLRRLFSLIGAFCSDHDSQGPSLLKALWVFRHGWFESQSCSR